MSKWNMTATVVGGLVAGLMVAAGATAWADTFTPSIEEPVFQLGMLRGTPLGGVLPGGDSTSAESGRVQQYSTSGRDYRHSSAEEFLAETPADRDGYWRADGGQDR